MGMTCTTYVGPMARCRNEKVAATKEIYACPNEACERHRVNSHRSSFRELPRFCPACGTAMETMAVPGEAWAVDPWDLEQVLEERYGYRLYFVRSDDDKVQVWTSNESDFEPARSFGSSDGDTVTTVTPDDVERETQAFRARYADELAALEEAYGNIEIGWGIVHYWT